MNFYKSNSCIDSIKLLRNQIRNSVEATFQNYHFLSADFQCRGLNSSLRESPLPEVLGTALIFYV